MEKYRVLEKLGSGAFGNVWKVMNREENTVLAVKELKKKLNQNQNCEEMLNLTEVRALRRLKNHPNIVQLKEVVRQFDSLFLVFECMDSSLRDLMEKRRVIFSEDEVKNYCFQIFKGLAYMHSSGIFHRDLKPENLLVSDESLIKIADFGSAREIDSKPPFTEYITTRWYRAPEVLLQSTYVGEAEYNSAVDMWAMGAIMAEFYRMYPLFRGESVPDQIYQICRVLGSPTESEWPQGHELARGFNYEFPEIDDSKQLHLYLMIPMASDEAFDLIRSLLNWDPTKRPNAFEVLQHSFFQSCYSVVAAPRIKRKIENFDIKKIYSKNKKRAIRTSGAKKIERKVADKNFDFKKLFPICKRAIRTNTMRVEIDFV